MLPRKALPSIVTCTSCPSTGTLATGTLATGTLAKKPPTASSNSSASSLSPNIRL
jgi:hypothetical protein